MKKKEQNRIQNTAVTMDVEIKTINTNTVDLNVNTVEHNN